MYKLSYLQEEDRAEIDAGSVLDQADCSSRTNSSAHIVRRQCGLRDLGRREKEISEAEVITSAAFM